MPDPARDVLISLCERALRADMTLDELERAWPEPVENGALRPLREAVEDGIEHTPGYFLGCGVNVRAWKRSRECSETSSPSSGGSAMRTTESAACA